MIHDERPPALVGLDSPFRFPFSLLWSGRRIIDPGVLFPVHAFDDIQALSMDIDMPSTGGMLCRRKSFVFALCRR